VWKFSNVSGTDYIPILRVLLMGTESVPKKLEHCHTLTLLFV